MYTDADDCFAFDGFCINQGGDFRQIDFTWNNPPIPPATEGLPVDLSGYSAVCYIANKFGAPNTRYVTATNSNGMITLGGTSGDILVDIPAASLAAIPAGTKEVVYQLILTSGGGKKYPLMKGIIRVSDGA